MRIFYIFALLCFMSIYPQSSFASNAEDDDFDGDDLADFAVFRPINGTWFIRSSDSGNPMTPVQWGLIGDVPFTGNYLNSSRPAMVVYRQNGGMWFIRESLSSSDLTYSNHRAVQWGGFPGDIPDVCDFSWDGRQDLVIYRSGTWFIRRSTSYNSIIEPKVWGQAGDRPVPADYDRDGKCDYAVFRNGQWFILYSSKDYKVSGSIQWGQARDIPMIGRFDDDSSYDFAVYRESQTGGNSLWIIRESSTQGLTSRVLPWGVAGDIPMIKDVDGDHRHDLVIYRPSTGQWWARLSDSDFNQVQVQQWGLPTDIPIGDRRGGYRP